MTDRHYFEPDPGAGSDPTLHFDKKFELEKAISSSKFTRSYSRRRTKAQIRNLQVAVLKLTKDRFETHNKQVLKLTAKKLKLTANRFETYIKGLKLTASRFETCNKQV